MKLRMGCSAVAALFLGLMTGCGGDDSAAGGNSGEYISSSWHDDTVAHFLVKPNGELSGYLLVMYGDVYEMTGSVSDSGVLTLSVKDPETKQPVPGTTTTGTCDGAGTCTGTLNAGRYEPPFQYVLVRVTERTNKFAGIYKAPLTDADADPLGTSWFGIDAHGKGYGFAEGVTVTGAVTESGNFNLTNLPAWSAFTMSGNIGTDGTISNGTWSSSTSSGTLSGSKLPLD